MSVLKRLNTPVFAAEGVLRLDAASYRLEVAGLQGENMTFTLDGLKRDLPAATVNMRLTSVSGWSVRADWDGIPWRAFTALVKPSPSARYALFHSADGYTTCVLLTDLEASTAMLVWSAGGEPLEPEYGGPLRMVVPNLWGYKSCKWVTKIEFVDKYVTGYWEMRGYSHRGEIEPGETLDVNTQKYRPINGGEVTEF